MGALSGDEHSRRPRPPLVGTYSRLLDRERLIHRFLGDGERFGEHGHGRDTLGHTQQVLGAVEPASGGEAIFVEDAAFGETAEREHVDAMAPSEFGERASDDRHHEIARLPAVHFGSASFDARQALVTQNQSIAAGGRGGTLREQDFAIGAADAQFQCAAEQFARAGRGRLWLVPQERLARAGNGGDGEHAKMISPAGPMAPSR